MTARRMLVLTALSWVVAAAPAHAIPNTCPTTGPDAATVVITEPSAGATFAGQVTVRGRASAAAGLTKVELFVGEALKDVSTLDPARTEVEFFLRFDVAGVGTNTPAVTVVACGGSAGATVRGVASIEVKVDRAAVTTTPPPAAVPVERDGDRAGTRTGPAWVGAAFGVAGLAGLLAATGLRRSRDATEPSSGPAPPAPARRRRPDREGDGTAPPPRPSPADRDGLAPLGKVGALAVRPPAAPAESPPAVAGGKAGRRKRAAPSDDRPRPGAGDGRPRRRR